MRLFSLVFYVVGTIISFILGISLLVTGIANLAGNATIGGLTFEESRILWVAMIVYASICLITGVVCFIGFSIVRANKNRLWIHILTIVFGAINFDIIILLAGIFGIMGNKEIAEDQSLPK